MDSRFSLGWRLIDVEAAFAAALDFIERGVSLGIELGKGRAVDRRPRDADGGH